MRFWGRRELIESLTRRLRAGEVGRVTCARSGGAKWLRCYGVGEGSTGRIVLELQVSPVALAQLAAAGLSVQPEDVEHAPRWVRP